MSQVERRISLRTVLIGVAASAALGVTNRAYRTKGASYCFPYRLENIMRVSYTPAQRETAS